MANTQPTDTVAWWILICAVLIAVCNLIDFLLGQKGQRRLKDKLVNFYILVSEPTWRPLILRLLRTIDSFLSKILGDSILSVRALLLSYLFSVAITFIYLVLADLNSQVLFVNVLTGEYFGHFLFTIYLRPELLITLLLPIFVINPLFDLASLCITRWCVRSSGESKTPYLYVIIDIILVMFLFAIGFSHSYAAFSSAIESAFTLRNYFSISSYFDAFTNSASHFVSYISGVRSSSWAREGIILNFSPHISYSIFDTITIMIPVMLYVTLGACCFILALSRSITQAPLQLIAQRLEEAPNGLFTTCAAVLTALSAILVAGHRLLQS